MRERTPKPSTATPISSSSHWTSHEQARRDQLQPGLVSEFIGLILLLGSLVVLGGTAAAAFIYTLF
jgi:hypothetical protein